MNMITKKDIVDTITILKMTYPGALKDFSATDLEAMVEIWYQDFKDSTKDEFNKAINEIRYTSQYFPSVATIKEKLTSKIDIPDANDEWLEVIKAVRKFGSYREKEALESLNPYTAQIVKYIGFYRICTSTQDEQKWNKKEFIAEYNTLKDKHITNLQIGNKGVNLLNG